jgi:DNA primase
MTIRDVLVQGGYLRQGSNKACCPFHNDNTPSAKVFEDTGNLYCYACRRLYGAADFQRKFGVVIDQVSVQVVDPEDHYEWGEVLFYA